MSPEEAKAKIRDLVQLRTAVIRLNQLIGVLVACPEIKTAATEKAYRASHEAMKRADALEAELVRLLVGKANDSKWSVPDSLEGSGLVPTIPKM